jgi:DNA invertase Pin-like site-specific DNA recombinase
MGSIHQVERELRAERAVAGRASAKARGESGGRPRTDVSKLETAKVLYENSGKRAAEVFKVAGVGRRTFFAYLAEKRKESHSIRARKKERKDHPVDNSSGLDNLSNTQGRTEKENPI